MGDIKATRHLVIVSKRLAPKGGKGRGKSIKMWGYGYKDLAELLGISEGRVRVLVYKKELDPSDIISIVYYFWRNRLSLNQ